MSFFDDFLRFQGEQMNPDDKRFDERDWSAFVFALMQLRAAGRIVVPPGSYEIGVPLLHAIRNDALPFVSRFLCYFVPKPPKYQKQIAGFKRSFVPDFAFNEEVQQRLAQSVAPRFSKVSLDEAGWSDVREYVMMEEADASRTTVPA